MKTTYWVCLCLLFGFVNISSQDSETIRSTFLDLTGAWIGTFDQNYGASDDPAYKTSYDDKLYFKGVPTHSFTLILAQKDSSVVGQHYIELKTDSTINVKFEITGKFQNNILYYKSSLKEFENGPYKHCDVFNVILTYSNENGEEKLEGVWTGSYNRTICAASWISVKRVEK